MIFWASVEGFQPAYISIVKTERYVESYLNEAFSTCTLESLVLKLRYIPIIMPKGMKENYPARTRVRKKELIYDCAPQLNYEVFVDGTFEEQLREYLSGIAPTDKNLKDLGASPEQITDFRRIMANAEQEILKEYHRKSLH